MKTKKRRKRLEIKLWTLMGALLLFISPALASFAEITEVTVIPTQPATGDPVTLSIAGSASCSNSRIVSSVLQRNQNEFVLDLTVDMGILTAESWWSHSEQIGILAPGDYIATINVFYPYAGPGEELQNSQITEFRVTPEPGMLVLLGCGLPMLRIFLARGSINAC